MHHFTFRLLVGQTKDGRWLQFAQNRPHLFEAFLRALDLDWMLTDPKWEGIPVLEDEALRVELMQQMLASVRDRTFDEWQQIFELDRDVFAELYRCGTDVLDHPQLVHDGAVVELDDPERGPVRQPGPQFVMSASPPVLRGPAPALDDGSGAAWSARPASVHPPAPAGRPPLEGVTVLELAVQYAAPYGVTLLADLGARVIKIEPLEGDSIRRQQLAFPEVGGGKVMQGKESVAVDLHTPEGVELVHQLAARVDAVVDGFRSGAAERLGVDAATLHRINPDLLYLSATGYGTGGPCGDRAAFAPSFGAAGGIAAAHLGGPGPEDPTISLDDVVARSILLRGASASRYASADGVGALGVATALLLGLVARARGAGRTDQHLVSSMLLSTAHAMANDVIEFPGGTTGAAGPGPDLRGPNALYHLYDAADGWVFLAAPQASEWTALAAALRPHVALDGDPRFADTSARAANDAALVEVLARVFATRGKDEWQRELTACWRRVRRGHDVGARGALDERRVRTREWLSRRRDAPDLRPASAPRAGGALLAVDDLGSRGGALRRLDRPRARGARVHPLTDRSTPFQGGGRMTMKDQAAVAGIGATPLYRRGASYPQESELSLACKAVLAACDDAGIAVADIDGFANYSGSPETAELAAVLGVEEVRFCASINGGGGASGATLGLAAAAIHAGSATTVLTLMSLQQANRRLGGSSVGGSLTYGQASLGVSSPYGAFTANDGLLSPGHAAGLIAQRHMHLFGTKREHFAEVVISSRENAVRNPRAMMRDPLTLDDYFNARMINEPLCLFDFTLETDGAVAILTVAADRAQDLRQPPVYIMGSAHGGIGRTGPLNWKWLQMPDEYLVSSGSAMAARRMYDMAGVGPEDVDVALVYDNFAPMVIMQMEDYGFCPRGEGGAFVADGNIRWKSGTIPVNTHGGNLSEGYVIGMTHVREAVEQLRGTAVNQVDGAEIALVTGGTSLLPMGGTLLRR